MMQDFLIDIIRTMWRGVSGLNHHTKGKLLENPQSQHPQMHPRHALRLQTG